MRTYGSGEIQKIAGITKIQAVQWAQQGAVKPMQDIRGRGGRRVYSQQNLIEFMICRELNRFTIETRLMVLILEFLRRFPENTRIEIPTNMPPEMSFTSEDYYRGKPCFWDKFMKDPKQRAYLQISPETKKTGISWIAVSFLSDEGEMITRASTLVIDVRKLMEEVQE